MKNEKQHIDTNIASRQKAIRDLYLDLSQGIIEKEQFTELNDGFISERHTFETRLETINIELANLLRVDDGESNKKRLYNGSILKMLRENLLPVLLIISRLDRRINQQMNK